VVRDLLFLHPGALFADRHVRHPLVADQVEVYDLYDVATLDLGRFLGVIVSGLSDQDFLWTQRARIRAFLEAGGVLVFSGHLYRLWIPGAGPFVPKVVRTFRDYELEVVRPHPVFEGVAAEDLTYRRGVAGFFARGHHPPPKGAQVVVAFRSGEPVVYVDRQSTAGTILVHSGNDLLGYAVAEGTAARLVPQLLAWMRTEGARNRAARR
jgi:hypothetical protein